MVRDFQRLAAPLLRRLRLMVGRGVVRLVDDAYGRQRVQVAVLDGELADQIERFQDYGLTSNPPAGSEAIVLNVGGSRDHAVAVCVEDRRFRLRSLKPGEVALYTDEGDVIHFKRGHEILISSRSVKVAASDVIFSGSVSVDGNLSTKTGASGAFTTLAGQVVTVQNGIIIGIV